MTRLFPLLLLLTAATSAAQTEPGPSTAGPKIVAEAFGKLSAALAAAVAKDGPAGSVPVCAEKAPQIAAEIGKTHGVTVRRASAKPRNPKNAADEAEQAALASFSEALRNQEAPKPRTITQADGRVTYFAPIVLGLPLCLQCHGTPGRDIAPATLDAIRKRYPEDKATGFKLGDLRGLWRVTFPARG